MNWEEMVAEMPLDDQKINAAIVSYEAILVKDAPDSAWVAWTDAAEDLNEREKIELNCRLSEMP